MTIFGSGIHCWLEITEVDIKNSIVCAVLLAGQVMHHVEQRLLAEHPLPAAGWVEDDLAIPGETVEVIDGFPGMKYSITFKTSSERPDVVLAVVRVAWRDQGEDQGQEFKRLLPRIVPLARRVDPRRNPR